MDKAPVAMLREDARLGSQLWPARRALHKQEPPKRALPQCPPQVIQAQIEQSILVLRTEPRNASGRNLSRLPGPNTRDEILQDRRWQILYSSAVWFQLEDGVSPGVEYTFHNRDVHINKKCPLLQKIEMTFVRIQAILAVGPDHGPYAIHPSGAARLLERSRQVGRPMADQRHLVELGKIRG